MVKVKYYDFFITHAWRFHDNWNRMVELLDSYDNLSWRNYSVPWYDPALQLHTESGRRSLREILETQILPAQAIILLSSVYAQSSSRKWLDFEIETARKNRKWIIAVPTWGESEVPQNVQRMADDVACWDVSSILATVDKGSS